MLDTVRRVLGFLMIVAAIVGLVPLIPLVFGFSTATVTNDNSGTYYPTTTDAALVYCQQNPTSLTLKRNQTYSGKYMKCWNNWGSAVTITWNDSSANVTATGSTLSIPAGTQGQCVDISLNGSKNGSYTVNYKGTIDQSDLYAEVNFTGSVSVQTGNSTPLTCQ